MNCIFCTKLLPEGVLICPSCGGANRDPKEGEPVSGEHTSPSSRRVPPLDGKWQVIKPLGQGGMAAVFLAHDLQLDRKVAVKIIAPELAQNPDLVERFEREARLTANLEHPNIVPIYAVGRTPDGRPYIVMKLLEGQTLSERLEVQRTFTAQELLPLLTQMCAGLDFIHSKGFVHRDIKPPNIFVSSTGQLTLLDLGIMRPASSDKWLTRTGMFVGTPRYLSPEQALGTKEVDHRTDIYALGILLYECLTGSTPFNGDTDLALVQQHAHAMPPPIGERAPGLPPGVGEVVMRALAKRPEQRFNSAGELLKAYQAGLEGAPLPISAPGLPLPGMPELDIPISRPDQPSYPGPREPTPPSNPTRSMRSGPRPQVEGGRPRWQVAGLGIGVALALVAAGLGARSLLTRPATQPEHPTQVAPEPAQVAPVAVVAPTGPAPVAALDAGQAEVDAGPASVDAGSSTPDAGPATVDAGPAPVQAPVAVIEPTRETKRGKRSKSGKPGKISVLTTYEGAPYWAAVAIDGAPQGRTPVMLELPPGRHDLLVERAGFRDVRKKISVASGGTNVVRIELRP